MQGTQNAKIGDCKKAATQMICTLIICVAASSAFDRDILLVLHRRPCLLLGDLQLQGPILKPGLDILLGDLLAYIEAPAAGAAVTLPADVAASLIPLFTSSFFTPGRSMVTS